MNVQSSNKLTFSATSCVGEAYVIDWVYLEGDTFMVVMGKIQSGGLVEARVAKVGVCN